MSQPWPRGSTLGGVFTVEYKENNMTDFFDILSTYGLFLGIPILFLLIVFWVYRPGARRRYEDDARLPFEEDGTRDRPTPPLHT